MGVRRNSPRGGKVDILLTSSGCWGCNPNGRSQNASPFQHHKENVPCYGNSPKNALRLQQCFFSHRIKLLGLLLSAVIVSLHYLLSCHRCLCSTVTCGKKRTGYCRNFFQKWTFVAMWLLRNKDHYYNNLLTSFATWLCSRQWSGLNELQAHHRMTPEKWTAVRVQCDCHIGK